MSWCTRGQLSVEGKIMAATGFQIGNLSLQEIHDLFFETLKNDKELLTIQHQLRSGKDIFKYGGSVTDVYSDKMFRLLFDNKRIIINNNDDDDKATLLDSEPLNNVRFNL